MTSVVVLFAYPIKLNVLTKNGVTKILPKKLHCHFILFSQYNHQNAGQNFVFINTLTKILKMICFIIKCCLETSNETAFQ